MPTPKQYLQIFQELKRISDMYGTVVNQVLIELEKEPAVPRQRRNLKDERRMRIERNMITGKYERPFKPPKPMKK